jgi:hypothetical protein
VIIETERWEYIKQHASIPHRGIPAAVVEAIAAVVPGAKIEAAWPDWNSTDSTTTWTCWIVTPEALGYVRVEYGRADYDEPADREHKLTPSSQSAWVRKLTSVVGLQFGAFCEANERDAYHPVAPITVMFSVGQTTIPETDFPAEQRQTADRFLTALRRGLGF